MTVFCVDVLALFEVEAPVEGSDWYGLITLADQTHFDPARVCDEGSVVSEGLKDEFAAQLLVNSYP